MSDHGATPRKLGREDTAILIPVRLGGSRFPDKALEALWGKPLFWWAYRAAQASGLAAAVRVITDSKSVFNCCMSFKPWIDCVRLDENHPTGSDRLASAIGGECARIDNLAHLGGNDDPIEKAKIIINLQCDDPQVTPNDLALLAHAMWDSKTVQVATLATPLHSEDRSNPNVVTVIVDRRDRALYFTRSIMPNQRQRCLHHLGVYAFRRGALESFGRYPRGHLERAESLEQLRLVEEGVPINVVRIEGQRRAVNVKEDLEWLQQQKSPATT